MDNFKFVQAQAFQLSGSGLTSSATSVVVSSFKLPDGASTPITMAMFGSIGYAVLETGSAKEESISFTGVTQNGDGTATLTGVTRGLALASETDAPLASVPANQKSHGGSTSLTLANSSAFYQNLTGKGNDETVTGEWEFIEPLKVGDPVDDEDATNKQYVEDNYVGVGEDDTVNGNLIFTGANSHTGEETFTTSPIVPTPTTDTQASNKAYADGLSFAGVPLANETVKGRLKLSSAPSDTAEPTALNIDEVLAEDAEPVAGKVPRYASSGKLDVLSIPPQFQITAGEDLSAGEAVSLTTGDQTYTQGTLSTAGFNSLYDITTTGDIYMPFEYFDTITGDTVTQAIGSVDLGSTGSGYNYGVRLHVYAYSSGATNKTTGSALWSSAISGNLTDIAYSATLPALTSGTTYTMRLEIFYASYAGGSGNARLTYKTGTVQDNMPDVGYFSIGGTNVSGVCVLQMKVEHEYVASPKVYKGFTDTYDISDCMGLIGSDVLEGEIADVARDGVITGLSGLTAGSFYKVNGDGNLTTTTSIHYKHCIALTETELAILEIGSRS